MMKGRMGISAHASDNLDLILASILDAIQEVMTLDFLLGPLCMEEPCIVVKVEFWGDTLDQVAANVDTILGIPDYTDPEDDDGNGGGVIGNPLPGGGDDDDSGGGDDDDDDDDDDNGGEVIGNPLPGDGDDDDDDDDGTSGTGDDDDDDDDDNGGEVIGNPLPGDGDDDDDDDDGTSGTGDDDDDDDDDDGGEVIGNPLPGDGDDDDDDDDGTSGTGDDDDDDDDGGSPVDGTGDDDDDDDEDGDQDVVIDSGDGNNTTISEVNTLEEEDDDDDSQIFLFAAVPLALLAAFMFLLARNRQKRQVMTPAELADLEDYILTGTGDPPRSFHEGMYHYTRAGARYLSTNCRDCHETRKMGMMHSFSDLHPINENHMYDEAGRSISCSYDSASVDTAEVEASEHDPSAHRKLFLVQPSDANLGQKASTVDVHQCSSATCRICSYKPKDVAFISPRAEEPSMSYLPAAYSADLHDDGSWSVGQDSVSVEQEQDSI
jgi:hypothetical protein